MEGILRLPDLAIQMVGKIKCKEKTDELVLEMKDIIHRMQNVSSKFALETNEDLIEACIYEQNALTARYRYLFSQAKQKGIKCTPVMYMAAQGLKTD